MSASVMVRANASTEILVSPIALPPCVRQRRRPSASSTRAIRLARRALRGVPRACHPSAMPGIPARAEVVGSLLRPPALRRAVEHAYAPGHRAVLDEERARDRSALHRLEDEAIDEAVRRQVDLGLDVVTDGEFRRYMFLNSFWDAVEGFSTDRNPVEFRGADGSTATWHVQRIEERLRVVDSPAAREAAYLVTATGGHPFKVTFPAAS